MNGVSRGRDSGRRDGEIPVVPYAFFIRRRREVGVLPGMESNGFLEISAKFDPNNVNGGALVFEYYIISFFLYGLENETR